MKQFLSDEAAVSMIFTTSSSQSSSTDSRLGLKAVGGFRLVSRTKSSVFVILGLPSSDEAGFADD